jgi:Na+/serine symporter
VCGHFFFRPFLFSWLDNTSGKEQNIREKIVVREPKGVFGLSVVKSMVKSAYRGVLFILFLSVMLLCTVLLLAFLANPSLMMDSVERAFGMVR